MTAWLPSVEQVVLIHARLLAAHGGAEGILQQDRLEAAVASPRASFGGQDLHVDPIAKAVALFFSLAHGHAFRDGNKRTAIACLDLVLTFNGCVLLANAGDLESLVLSVACGEMERDAADAFVRARCRIRMD
ncbi:MAG: type II toxin-antitoxin system death-on-curing family toxin [Planctomycetota bacterium]